MGINNLLPLATKLWQGNVFTPVCDSVYEGCLCLWGLCPGGSLSMGSLSREVSVEGSLSGGVCWGSLPRGVSVQGGLCPRGSLSGGLCLGERGLCQRDPPTVWLCAGGTYPTEMHSCYCPQRSCEGYVFTPVCLSTGGVCLSACWDTTPSREQAPSPQSRHTFLRSRHPPPGAGTPHHPQQTATVPDGTHPNAFLSSNFITTIKMTT